ncbi:MAG: M23 family metallopeptidase [Flavobacteriaceae bacterium]|nr:M23 family metallopeptidase [Flavobacteriaceae bacterium]
MKKSLLLIALLSQLTHAQVKQQIEFANPLNISINASGNFGELRGSHFHTGIDIKTQQRIGLPVYAPADGYVSRIKVSTWGYGKALYIDHPNGITTVYGHLNEYAGDIAKLVKNRHYKEQKFEIEIFLKKDELKVKKGDIIAFTGNTGGSGGPHLHYEFRDTKTEHILNPLQMGMDKMLVDTQVPTINSLYVYPVSDDAVANKSQQPVVLALKQQANGEYNAETVYAQGVIGFGIDIYDTSDFNTNKNGVYNVQTYANGKALFGYKFNEFSFAETGYVNALIDYPHAMATKQKVQKLFFEKSYPLSVLTVDKDNNGLVAMTPGQSYNYRIELKDYHGNKKVVNVPIVYRKEEASILKKQDVGNYKIEADREFIYEKDGMAISIPSQAFYRNFTMNISYQNNVLILHKNTEAVAKNIMIAFNTDGMNISNPDKSFIARTDGNRKDYIKTYKKGNKFTAYVKSLGQYQILTDNTAPEIYNASFKEGDNLDKKKSISFKVRDTFSGISNIEGSINGQWILLDYDYKTQQIIHYFADGIVASGKNNVVIKVTDNVGNEKKLETHFFRQ